MAWHSEVNDAAVLLSSLSNDNGYVPSVAAFPSVKSDSHGGKKKSRGRPRKSEEGEDSPMEANAANDNNGGSGEPPKKKRGRPRKKEEEASKQDLIPGKGNYASNVTSNDGSESPAK